MPRQALIASSAIPRAPTELLPRCAKAGAELPGETRRVRRDSYLIVKRALWSSPKQPGGARAHGDPSPRPGSPLAPPRLVADQIDRAVSSWRCNAHGCWSNCFSNLIARQSSDLVNAKPAFCASAFIGSFVLNVSPNSPQFPKLIARDCKADNSAEPTPRPCQA